MTFTELANITGKPVRTITQVFYRKGLSIKDPADVQAYLHLAFRPRQVRSRQPQRRAEHLAKYRFISKNPAPLDVTRIIAEPRQFGNVDILSANRKVLQQLAREFFADTRSLFGILAGGDFVNDSKGSELVLLVVYLTRTNHAIVAERAKYSFTRITEEHGITGKLHITTVDHLPGVLAADPNLKSILKRGRIEYGWVTI